MNGQPTIGSVGRSAIWSLVNNVAGQALSLLVFLVTARYVSKDAFGIMAICLTTVESFRQIIIISFVTALASQKSPDAKDYNACFFLILFSGVVSALCLYYFAAPLSQWLGHAEVAPTLKFVCLILLTTGLSQTHEVWLSKHLQFKTIALRSIISLVAGGGVGIYMAMHGYGLDALIAQQVVTALTALIFLWTATAWRPGIETGKGNLLALLHYSKYVVLSRGTSFFGSQSDVYFASYYFGVAATGTYNAGKRILLAVSATLNTGLNAVAFPAFAAYGHGSERLSRGFLKAATLTALLTTPLYSGLFVMSDDAIALLMGDKWLDAAPILSALVISAYLSSVGQYNHNIFLVAGKPHWEMILNVAYAVGNILLFLWFVHYGTVMLAAASSLRALILYPLSLLPALSLLDMPLRVYLKEMLPPVLGAAVMATIIYLLKIYVFADMAVMIRVLILVPAGALIYAGCIYVLNRSMYEEVFHIIKHTLHK